jgi:hypothetical protein
MQHSDTLAVAPARAQRPRKTARSWGDINLTLNRLVREGVISKFKTNLSSPDRNSGLEVAIIPVPNSDAEEARERVLGDLEALVEGVTVTIQEPEPA